MYAARQDYQRGKSDCTRKKRQLKKIYHARHRRADYAEYRADCREKFHRLAETLLRPNTLPHDEYPRQKLQSDQKRIHNFTPR